MDKRAPDSDKEPLLLPSRAFVLQFYPQADVAQEVFVGRVEHVVSGQAARFATLDELLAFLERMLSQTAGT